VGLSDEGFNDETGRAFDLDFGFGFVLGLE
jgi:hypothetical protein